jgi:competence ComEA-like helix-hairpin-helix protein
MLNLTKQERQVVLFLSALAIAGLGINFLSKRFPAAKAIACLNPDLGKVDINLADKRALVSIPGIGEKLAQRILDYRGQKSKFCDVEELKNIKGITGHRFEQIKDRVCVK